MDGLIRDEDISLIRDKANIVDLISQQMTLKKAGRTYKGLCPFHQEKTPSFTVDPVKQLFHCFGCGEGGDVFSFVMKTEGLSFAEAVESLGRRVGHAIQFKQANAQTNTKTRLYEINSAAGDFFSRLLMSTAGNEARRYLKSRGFDKEIAEKMRLGYAPDSWEALADHLQSRGFSEHELLNAGLASKGNQGKVYDRFRQRLIFPISDIQGRIVGFGGRVLDNGTPKYLNSPETPVYNKGAILYGLYQAKSEISQKSSAIIVEGYTDLLSMMMAGINNAVATCGTAFTLEHLRLLSRFTDSIVLVFDGDSAGVAAAERGLEYLSQFRLPGKESLKSFVSDSKVGVRVSILPDELDPADYLKKHGSEKFNLILSEAIPFTDFYLERIIGKHDLKDQEERRRAIREALAFIRSLESAVDQEDYLRKTAELLRVPLETLQLDFRRVAGKDRSARGGKMAVSQPRQTASSSAEKEMLQLILQTPEKSAYLLELSADDWQEDSYNQLFTVLKSKLEGKGKLDVENIVRELPVSLQNLASKLMLEDIVVEDREQYFFSIFLRLKEFSIDRQIKRLIGELKDITEDEQESLTVEKRLFELQNQRREIRNQIV